MKLKIKKHKVYCEANIYGKPINSYEYYTIDMVFMGILRFPFRFTRNGNTLNELPETGTIYCKYTNPEHASQFQTLEDAQTFLNDIKAYPSRYIRIK